MGKETFVIVHTPRDVEYNINGFRLKNIDEVQLQLYETLS